jgi:L-alanine-DL-glutamate epimerase-like enolase superfamily enzyme
MQTMIVELTDGRYSGYGESSTNPYYKVTIDSLTEILAKANDFLKNYKFLTPEKLWSDLDPMMKTNRFAQSALDCAAYDFYAKKSAKKVSDILNINSYKFPFTSYTLGIDKPAIMKKKMKDLPWPIYKVKLGTSDDFGIMNLLYKNSSAVFRVDANCAWESTKAIEMSAELKKLRVECMEQPLPPEDRDGIRLVYENSKMPVIADESCRTPEDVAHCVGYFHGINIKLAKCGGLTPALKMVNLAKKRGLRIMIGCMTETTVGMVAAAQLLSFADYADLDGPLLLAEDVASGLSYIYGMIRLEGGVGLGIDFKGKKFRSEHIR